MGKDLVESESQQRAKNQSYVLFVVFLQLILVGAWIPSFFFEAWLSAKITIISWGKMWRFQFGLYTVSVDTGGDNPIIPTNLLPADWAKLNAAKDYFNELDEHWKDGSMWLKDLATTACEVESLQVGQTVCTTMTMIFWGSLIFSLVLITNIILLLLATFFQIQYFYVYQSPRSRRWSKRLLIISTIILWLGLTTFAIFTINTMNAGALAKVFLANNEPTLLHVQYWIAVMVAIFQGILCCVIQSFPTYHPGEEKIAKEQEKKEDELDDAEDRFLLGLPSKDEEDAMLTKYEKMRSAEATAPVGYPVERAPAYEGSYPGEPAPGYYHSATAPADFGYEHPDEYAYDAPVHSYSAPGYGPWHEVDVHHPPPPPDFHSPTY